MIGFLDCYSGISGDMLLGALVDAGLPLDALRDGLVPLGLDDAFSLSAEEVSRAGVRATKVSVVARVEQPHRPFRDVVALITAAGLPEGVRDRSLAILGRVARAEARIHGGTPDDVELHEVGAIDSIVDVVGSVLGFEWLGIDELHASALPVAPGDLRSASHRVPLPGPAVMALLVEAHAPTRPFGDGVELVTPTGAAIATTLATFDQPPMVLERIGYGAGGADHPWPNVLRLWVGSRIGLAAGEGGPEQVLIETNIDDMAPQLLAPVTERLLEAGALDVTVAPVTMKKGRSAVVVSVVAPATHELLLADLLLRETTTLGVRVHSVRRHTADRAFDVVETPFGHVVVKMKLLGGEVVAATPEFESVRGLAAAAEMPLIAVHAAAVAAATELVARRRSGAAPPAATPSRA